MTARDVKAMIQLCLLAVVVGGCGCSDFWAQQCADIGEAMERPVKYVRAGGAKGCWVKCDAGWERVRYGCMGARR